MAVLKVPSQYSTISAAISASSSGDDIEVDGGTHGTIAFPSGKTSLRVRAKRGTQPVVSGTGALITYGTGTDNCVVQGLKFVRTGTSTTAIASTLRQAGFVDCVFDATGWNQTVGVSQWIQARAMDGLFFSRCTFLGSSNLAVTQVLAVAGLSTAAYRIESCLFFDCSASAALIKDVVSTPASIVVRNNTFLNCTVARTAVDVEATGVAAIYNNAFYNLTALTPGSGSTVLIARTGVTSVSNNIIHNNSGIVSDLASPDSGNNRVVDPLLTAEGKLTAASPCVGGGITFSGDGERRVHIDRERRAYAETPDIGAYAYRRGQRAGIYIRSPNVDVLSGVTFNVNSQGDVTPPSVRTAYDSPWDTALALEHALTSGASRVYGPLEVWYDDLNNRYRMATYHHTFDLSIAGASAKVFGAASETGISDTG